MRPVHDDDGEVWEDETKRSLDKRGWCLQESLLPSRRLCFNGDEMVWECLCRTICECGHILWKPQPFAFGRLGAYLKSKRLKAEVAISHPQPARPWHEAYHGYDYKRSGPGYPEKPYRRWRDIVVEYSKRSLSLQKDKLSAVSGLAKLVREGLPGDHQGQDEMHLDEYLAGLWRREFHFDLAWIVETPEPEQVIEARKGKDDTRKSINEGEKSGIPSWSWASVDAPVTFRFDKPLDVWKYQPNLIDCVKVESASCQRELVHDETSAVTSGQAVLTGLASPVELAVRLGSEGKPQAFVRSANLDAVKVTLDQPRSLTVLPGNQQEACWEKGECQHGGGCCNWRTNKGEISKGQDDGLICLVLFSWIAPTGNNEDGGKWAEMGPETWFLVLKPSNSVEGAFERIGIGSYFDRVGVHCKLFADSESATVKIV